MPELSASANTAIVGIYKLLLISFVIFVFYIAQAIIIPLTIAALLTFLLAPLVTHLEKFIGRISSIILVVIIAFSFIGFFSYLFARQMILFGANIPTYSENLQKKLHSFSLPDWEIFNRLDQAFKNFQNILFGESPPQNAEMKLLDWGGSLIHFFGSFFGSFFNVLLIIGIVLLLVLFMLLNREDLRRRIIALAGYGKKTSTKEALDDAGYRLSTYLYRLLIVNIFFGVCVSIGLIVIGVPSPILWGCFAMILRFVPYLGSWIAALIPIALSFVITSTWAVPLLTISLFGILEIITAYVIEPFYYGGGIGVSSFALIIAAIFWTWLWGPVGLLLSTPITACLVVIGQHMTNMKFLDVLLSQDYPSS